MKCTVFRSDKKSETYLYVSAAADFDDLPANLRRMFGEPAFVMELELSKESRLARVDASKVIQGLEQEGFFLQLPPELPTEEEISRLFT
jgi:uncharacterized protein YcgL (UPF0745 family)